MQKVLYYLKKKIGGILICSLEGQCDVTRWSHWHIGGL